MIKNTVKIILILLAAQITALAGGVDFSIYGVERRLTIPGWILLVGLPLIIISSITFLGISLLRKKNEN